MTAQRGMTPDDLFRIVFIDDVQFTPNGETAVFVVTTMDGQEDEYRSAIWLVGVSGNRARRLTNGPKRDTQPHISPDGRHLAFVRDPRSKEDRDARPQLWILPMDGGDAWQLCTLPNGAARPVWSSDGRALLVTSRLTPEDGLSKEEKETHRSRARVIDRVRYKLNGEPFQQLLHRAGVCAPARLTEQVCADRADLGY